MPKTIQQILNDEDGEELYSLFSFDEITTEYLIVKFNVWSRYFFPQFFSSRDASFHKEIDENNSKAYLGEIDSFTNLGFRGCAKTTRTKLFIAFIIANDLKRRHKYIKILSKDGSNSKQIVTDVYNLLIEPRVKSLYSEIFAKTDTKREETMSSFTTSTGIKLSSDTVGTDQRGQIQDESRPSFIVFDDYETSVSLRSAVITNSIWDNMEEARTGLAKGGACIYLGNYLSERGNVHKLVQKKNERNIVLIVPIWNEKFEPSWKERYTKEEIQNLKNSADDFEGEYLSEPAKGKDVFFDREMLKRMPDIEPIREIGEFKIFKEYNPSHRYACGADIAGGVGLDSSTSVFIDFSTFPAQVVATFKSNTIKPSIFGDELAKEGEKFGECLIAPENNKFDSAIGRLKQIYPNEKIYIQKRDELSVLNKQSLSSMDYGWNTNSLTKPKMLFALAKAIEDGLFTTNDKSLKAELWSYTRNDLMDSEIDPRLTTRHFDLLIACAIAWQMKDYAVVSINERDISQRDYELRESIEHTKRDTGL